LTIETHIEAPPLPSRILVTGATGLIGNALIPLLLEAGCKVRATARHCPVAPWARHPDCEFVAHDLEDDPASLVRNIDAVVHLAARVHVMRDTSADPRAENRRINTEATLALARAAVAAGVRQFVFMSTIKVNGEATVNLPYTETDTAKPEDAYATSKHEAEQQLAALAAATPIGVTILRPPLVYGIGVKGNLASLARAIERGLPLPLGAIPNRRSFVYAGNLADAVIAALKQPAPGVRTYLVSDGEDLSTTALIRAMAAAMQRPARLIPLPPALLRFAGKLTGRSTAVDRLLGSLVIDSSRIRRELGWIPRHSVHEGLQASLRNPAGMCADTPGDM
jgi:nucleoside-diphosphate-sugar epimerase